MVLQDTYLAIKFHKDKSFQDFFIKSLMVKDLDLQFSAEEIQHRRKAVESIADSKDQKLLYLSKHVQEEAKSITFEKINLGWFKKIASKKCTYILNKERFFRFWVNEQNAVHAAHFYTITNHITQSIEYKWDVFVIRLKEYKDGYMPIIPGQDEEAKKFFVQIVMFIELADITTKIIKPNQKIHVPVDYTTSLEKVKNMSGTDVLYVDINWNTTLIVSGKFKVSHHWRIQPCGKGRLEYKLRYIKDYEKTGYIRKASKIKHSDEL